MEVYKLRGQKMEVYKGSIYLWGKLQESRSKGYREIGKKVAHLPGKLLGFFLFPLEQKLHEDRDFWFAIDSPTELCLASR